MLPAAIAHLACPHCGDGLADADGSLRCPAGHTFDVARQGYVSLLRGDADTSTGDTADMVAARETFLGRGHLDGLGDRIATCAADLMADDGGHGCVLDVGAGTGRHTATLLDRLPGRVGLALDLSEYAMRRAARAHPRLAAVRCDVWRPLPVREGTAAVVLNVFAPRDGAGIRRVVDPGGGLLVVVPTPRHLAEIVGPLDLLTVDERKDERLAAALEPHFERVGSERHEETLGLEHRDVEAVVRMGPSAPHVQDAELRRGFGRLPDPVSVTVSVVLVAYRPR